MTEPKFRMFDVPVWYHLHGSKCRVDTLDLSNKLLNIEASAAGLAVRLRNTNSPYRWEIIWSVRHGADELDVGNRIFSDKDLEGAFLNDGSTEGGEAIIAEHGGSSAHQGYYLRFKRYLNIPGPGTGHDGDPNISIEVDETIKSAVQKLLESAQSKR